MKLNYAELNQLLSACPATGTLYKHFRNGHIYVVTGRSILEATQEPAVLYREENVPNAPTMVRSLKSWNEEVDGTTRFQEM